MFNQTDATTNFSEFCDYRNEPNTIAKNQTSESIFIHRDKIDESPLNPPKTPNFQSQQQSSSKDFSIFVDQPTSSQTSNNLNTFKLPSIPGNNLPNKYNQDGSLFVYDQMTENLKQTRKPLGSIDDLKLLENEKGPEIELDFNTQTTSLTKQIEFEPPIASTRNLRPILNKLNQFDLTNKLQTIVDDSFELSLDKVNEDNEEKDSEKEKLLNAHLNNLDKNNKLEQINSNERLFSKMMSDDCITTSTKWGLGSNNGTDCKKDINITTKQVKFQLITDDKTEIISSATRRNITSSQTTQVGVLSFGSWDYDYLEIGKDLNRKTNKHIEIEVDQTCKIIDQCELMQKDMQKDNISVPLEIIDETNSIEEAELLTNEKLEKTFNQDYYKLYHNDMFGSDNQSLFDINQPTQNTNLNISKLIGLKQITEFNEIERQEDELINKTVQDESICKIDDENRKQNLPNITLNGELIKDDNFVNNLTLVSETDTTCLGKSDNNSSIMTGATTTHLNETIINALRDPFSFEVKNRLINRGALDYLKKNPNYVSLRTNIPMIKEKINVSLKDGFTYKVIKEIGKGAYAKIYLIENKDSKSAQQYALKVNNLSRNFPN